MTLPYKPLDPLESEIRLLILLPPNRRDPADVVRCSLRHVSLDTCHDFTALSYAWGDPGATSGGVIIDGIAVTVGANLKRALLRLRPARRSLDLWVDAVCINQADIREKNVQVPLMARLYSTALSVVLFLGEGDADIERVVVLMDQPVVPRVDRVFARLLRIVAGSFISFLAPPPQVVLTGDEASTLMLEGYTGLFRLPYWSRVWTYQEMSLARADPVCVYGSATCHLSALVDVDKVREVVREAWVTLDPGVARPSVSRTSDTPAERFREVDAMGIPELTMAMASVAAARRRQVGDRTMGGTLALTAARQCYDPRDKVYGLYGLLPEAREANPVDYGKPTEEVLLKAAVYVINTERSAVLQAEFGLLPGRLTNLGYPSWVPDLLAGPESGVRWHGGRLVLAERLCRADASFRVVDKGLATLSMRARNLGPCSVLVHFGSGRDAVFAQVVDLVNGDLRRMLRGAGADRDALRRRVARLCVSHAMGADRLTEEVLEASDAAARSLDPWGPVSDAWPMGKAMELLGGKALITTARGGLFGICVGDVEDGDEVTLPARLEVPLVLRREPAASRSWWLKKRQYYRMVGTGIVDGIMRRKAKQGTDAWDASEPDIVQQVVEGYSLEELLVH